MSDNAPQTSLTIPSATLTVRERLRLLGAVSIVGVFSGMAAWALKSALTLLPEWLNMLSQALGSRWFMLPMPFVGILLAAILSRYILRLNLEHGTAQIRDHLIAGQSNLSPRIILGSLVGNALTLGFGGSAGSESPMAYTGASVAGNVARWFRLTRSQALMLIGIGGGAGIAAIFKSPIGGALFTIEVLGLSLPLFGLLLLFVSTLVASLTAFVLSGCTLDIAFTSMQHFSIGAIGWVLIVAVLCGLYSAYYRWCMVKFGQWINRVAGHWTRNIITGVLVSLLVFAFPALYGEGYGVVGKLLNGEFQSIFSGGNVLTFNHGVGAMLLVALCIILVKSVASAATNDGGGIAGQFAPALFAGCIAGFLFAGAGVWLLGVDVDITHMALICMAGVMAGALRAPLMSIFLVVEMSGQMGLILPVAIVAGVSYAISRLCCRV